MEAALAVVLIIAFVFNVFLVMAIYEVFYYIAMKGFNEMMVQYTIFYIKTEEIYKICDDNIKSGIVGMFSNKTWAISNL